MLLYKYLPVWVQNVLVNTAGFLKLKNRYGGEFKQIKERAIRREHYSEQELIKMQEERLESFLEAASRSDFWAQVYEENNIDLDDSPFVNYKKLPILKKETVKRNAERIIPSAYRKSKLIKKTTSGTTGSGLKFYATSQAEHERFASWWKYWNRHNITRKDWCGYFGGKNVVPVDQKGPPFWRTNRYGRQVLFSIFHLNRKNVAHYVNKIKSSDIEWLHGYPSALSLFANLIKDEGIEISDSIKIVTVGAENLLQNQKQIMESVFNAPVRQHYGLAEGVANISECEEGMLHVDEDYAYVEFKKVDGIDNHNTYRIIGTNWSNPAFPLIRYDTGDTVELGKGECPCGRNSRVVKSINGREEDYVILPDGRKIGRLDHIFKDLVNVKEAQIYQKSQQEVFIKIVRNDQFTDENKEKILKRTRQKIGNTINIEIVFVNGIKKSDSGKLKFVISEVN